LGLTSNLAGFYVVRADLPLKAVLKPSQLVSPAFLSALFTYLQPRHVHLAVVLELVVRVQLLLDGVISQVCRPAKHGRARWME
jgi:hypothetical protein